MNFENQIKDWIEIDLERMEALQAASTLHLNDWYIAAGFVRNLVWDRAAKILGQIRTGLSKAKRLIAPAMHEKLATLYFETLLSVDGSLEMLIHRGTAARKNEWRQQHNNSFVEAQNRIDSFLTELAIELKLAASTALAGSPL
jgi:hypothetical protein